MGVPRRSDRLQPLGARSVVLDSEALSALAWPASRSKSTRRAQAVLEAVVRLGGHAVIPAPVLAEVARGPARRVAVDRVVRRMPVVPADRAIAERTGELLETNKLDSCHAVDDFVAATAISSGYSLVLTGDPDDLLRLTAGIPGVAIQGTTVKLSLDELRNEPKLNFCDAHRRVELWGRRLVEELHRVYAGSAVVVVFVSADYVTQDWSNLERRVVLGRAVRERREYVLPARLDYTACRIVGELGRDRPANPK